MAQVVDPNVVHLLRDAPSLRKVLLDLPMQALDVGARRGFADDLLPLAPAIDAIAFEPDEEECRELNAEVERGRHTWRSLRYLPVALGPAGANLELNLYRQRGCSSLLEAIPEQAEEFSRGDDYVFEGSVPVSTMPLDAAAEEFGFTNASYMKIDVQGYEQAVFESGKNLLSGPMLAVRSEVTAIPLYKDMPLIEDIIAQMRGFDFMPMSFEEIHHWRRSTRVKHPRQSRGALPYSRGQLIHGDILFFRNPHSLPDHAETLLSAAFYALAYGHVDHAAMLMQRPAAARWLKERHSLDPTAELEIVSRRHARLHRQERIRQWKEDLRFRLAQVVRG